MKICLVLDAIPGCHEFWGGSEMIGWNIGEFLQKGGHEVYFFTTSFKKNATQKNVFQIPLASNKLSRISSLFSFFSTNLPVDIFSIFYSFFLLKKLKPDIIHFCGRQLFPSIMVPGIILKIPIVSTVLEDFLFCPKVVAINSSGEICKKFNGSGCFKCLLDSQKTNKLSLIETIKKSSKSPIIKLFSYLRPLFFNCVIKKMDLVFFLTETSRARFCKSGLPIKKTSLAYPYDLCFNANINGKFSTKFKNPSILFVGSLYPYKGCDILIKAMPHIVSAIPDVRLIIIGSHKKNDDFFGKRIKNIISDLSLSQYINFLDQKTNEEVLEIIRKCNVIVVAEQWSNPGPVILLESMALGKSVVASDIGSIPEFIKDGYNGFLVEYNSPEQFAEKIIYLLKNKPEANLMGKRAKETVQKFFNNNQAKKIIMAYNDVIKTKILSK